MRAKDLAVLEQCLDVGIESGWNRAHKHTDSPDDAQIKETIHQHIMNEIFQWFDFKWKPE